MPAMFKYKDKQQLLWGPGGALATSDFFVYTHKT